MTMIKLFYFKRIWGIPDLSPFTVKVETYLRMVNLPYELIEGHVLKGPKGKLPYIEDQGLKISDSSFIIDYLKQTYHDPLDQNLTLQQKTSLIAMQRLLEDHFYWIGAYYRWFSSDKNWQIYKEALFGHLPMIIRDIIAITCKKKIIGRQIYDQGISRHLPNEIFQLWQLDLDCISNFLSDKTYMLGKHPTSLDACAFGMLINLIQCPIDTPLKQYALSKSNLVNYCHQMMNSFFPDLIEK